VLILDVATLVVAMSGWLVGQMGDLWQIGERYSVGLNRCHIESAYGLLICIPNLTLDDPEGSKFDVKIFSFEISGNRR